MRETLKVILGAGGVALAIAACGEKSEISAPAEGGREPAPQHGQAPAGSREGHAEAPHVEADHGHADPHHGHDHPDLNEVPPVLANPYVNEPLPSEPVAQAEPEGEAPGPVEAVGVRFELTLGGQTRTLLVRGGATNATWQCEPRYGVVNAVDFTLDRPDAVGQPFVVRVDAAEPQRVRAGVSAQARISYRLAGEPGLTSVRGSAVWEPGYLSGRAEGQGEAGPVLRWTCLTPE